MAMSPKWEKLIKEYDAHCVRIKKATTIDINEKPIDKLNRIKFIGDFFI